MSKHTREFVSIGPMNSWGWVLVTYTDYCPINGVYFAKMRFGDYESAEAFAKYLKDGELA